MEKQQPHAALWFLQTSFLATTARPVRKRCTRPFTLARKNAEFTAILDEQISLTSLCAKSSPRLWRPGTGTWFFFVSPNYPPVVPRQTGVPNTSQLRSECLPWKASSAGSSVQNIQVLVGRCNRWKPRFIKNAFGLKKRIMWDWNEKYILFSRTTATLNQKPVAVLSSGSGPPSVAESLCGSNIGRSGLAVRSAWPDVGGKTFVQQTRPKNQQNIMHRQNIWS